MPVDYLEGLKQRAQQLVLTATCIRCGKELTDPHSVEQGMGPVCQDKHVPEDILESFLEDKPKAEEARA